VSHDEVFSAFAFFDPPISLAYPVFFFCSGQEADDSEECPPQLL
jgi:hypothetical protein